MTETQNDEDDTMTSDHDVTTVPKDVKKRLTSELERVDSVYNSSLINELLSQALLADITIQGARKLRGVLPLDMISFPFLQLREVR